MRSLPLRSPIVVRSRVRGRELLSNSSLQPRAGPAGDPVPAAAALVATGAVRGDTPPHQNPLAPGRCQPALLVQQERLPACNAAIRWRQKSAICSLASSSVKRAKGMA